MSYAKFIPTVWAAGIERELERTMVFAENTNRKYEGDAKQYGDSVRILGVGKPTITKTTDRNITLSDPEEVENTDITMNINQIAYYNYMVGDIDKAQMKEDVSGALKAETSEVLGDTMDKYLANMAMQREAVKLENAPILLTKDNILQTIDRAQQRLWENDVKQATAVTITVTPRFYMILREAYTKLDTDNSEMMKNGRVGKYGSIIVKMSNNVANDKGVDYIQVKTDRAIAFAHPLTHVEAYRPESKFADAIKGFILYDAKIVRPKEMIILPVKYQ